MAQQCCGRTCAKLHGQVCCMIEPQPFVNRLNACSKQVAPSVQPPAPQPHLSLCSTSTALASRGLSGSSSTASSYGR